MSATFKQLYCLEYSCDDIDSKPELIPSSLNKFYVLSKEKGKSRQVLENERLMNYSGYKQRVIVLQSNRSNVKHNQTVPQYILIPPYRKLDSS